MIGLYLYTLEIQASKSSPAAACHSPGSLEMGIAWLFIFMLLLRGSQNHGVYARKGNVKMVSSGEIPPSSRSFCGNSKMLKLV